MSPANEAPASKEFKFQNKLFRNGLFREEVGLQRDKIESRVNECEATRVQRSLPP